MDPGGCHSWTGVEGGVGPAGWRQISSVTRSRTKDRWRSPEASAPRWKHPRGRSRSSASGRSWPGSAGVGSRVRPGSGGWGRGRCRRGGGVCPWRC